MYEVFLNDRKMIITGTPVRTYLNNQVKIVLIPDSSALRDQVMHFLAGNEEQCIFQGNDNHILGWFQQLFRLLPAAGGIVHSEHGYLFIYRRGKWDFPKGKIDHKETAEQAALREVREETGLTKLTIDGFYPSTWHIYLSGYTDSTEEWILKETKWYSMKADGCEQPVPETAEDIEVAGWFKRENMSMVLANTYSNLKEMISRLT